jgi:hypothetical protein
MVDRDQEFLDLKAQVAAQAARAEAQAAEIAMLRARLEGSAAPTTVERMSAEGDGQTSRRHLFKLAGAAAVGAAGASLLSAAPAEATTGVMMFGTKNDAGADVTTLTSSNQATLAVTNTGNGNNVAVVAQNVSGSGYGVQAMGGLAPLWLVPNGTSGPPTTGGHNPGEVFVDANFALFHCVGAGTPGTWVRVGFNPLLPVRILDTRDGIGGITGPLKAGTVNLTVGGKNGVPTQASAVVMNATVTDGTAASYLTIWPLSPARPVTSNLNCTPGQTVANLVTVGLDPNGVILIFNNVGAVHVILDLAGFYC